MKVSYDDKLTNHRPAADTWHDSQIVGKVSHVTFCHTASHQVNICGQVSG